MTCLCAMTSQAFRRPTMLSNLVSVACGGISAESVVVSITPRPCWMRDPISSGNVAIAKRRCWRAYGVWRRIGWITNVVTKTFALNKNGDDSSIAYNIIKPNSSVSWKRNGLRFIWARPYRRLIRLRHICYHGHHHQSGQRDQEQADNNRINDIFFWYSAQSFHSA